MAKGRRSKNTIARLEKALIAHFGIISRAAQACGISRQTAWERVKNSPRLQEAIKSGVEQVLDIAENNVAYYVRRKDKEMTKYVLDRRGKPRGYGNKIETSVDEAQLEAFIASLGGDPEKFRAALASLGVSPDQI